MPPEVVLRLSLTAFGVRNVDEIIEKMVDDDGSFIWPESQPVAGGTNALTAAAHRGDDPAATGTGLMAGDDEPDDETDTGDKPGEKAPRRRCEGITTGARAPAVRLPNVAPTGRQRRRVFPLPCRAWSIDCGRG
jgi:hypothetical protein